MINFLDFLCIDCGFFYKGHGRFRVMSRDGEEVDFDSIMIIVARAGVISRYQLSNFILRSGDGRSRIRIIDANKTESDILTRGELDQMVRDHPDQFQIIYVSSRPGT